MSRRVDELFAGRGEQSTDYPKKLYQLRKIAIFSAVLGVLGPLTWSGPIAIVGSVWAWFGVREIAKRTGRLNAPEFLPQLIKSHKIAQLSLILTFVGCAYHIWLLRQSWYLGGLVGALLR